MATLPSSGSPGLVDGRAVVRCAHCKLAQYVTASGNCRRCSQPLQIDGGPGRVQAAPAPEPPPVLNPLPKNLAESAKALRILRGWSQAQLAQRMGGLPRTYVSKIESGRVMPTLGSLKRLAEALEVEVARLISSDGIHVADLRDPFLAALASHLPRLSDGDRRVILATAERMALHAKERAA